MPAFTITPPHLEASLLTDAEKAGNILLVNSTMVKNKASTKICLLVAMKTINVMPPVISGNRKTYRFGCTEASITLKATGKILRKATKGEPIPTQGTVTHSISKNASISISPELKDKDASLKAGAVKVGANKTQTVQTSFQSAERLLETINQGDTIIWLINKPPSGTSIVGDYLLGNILLEASIDGIDGFKGSIGLKPLDILCFNPNKKAVGSLKTILMRFHLSRKKIKILNPDGLTFEYQIS